MITHSLHTEHGHNNGWADHEAHAVLGLGYRRKYLIPWPPNDIADLVHFIFNNLSPPALSTMANEFCEFVGHAYSYSYLPWMAQYLVRRAGIGPNLHTLYMAFIGYLTDMCLDELVLQETYSQIRDILLADQPLICWTHFEEPWPLAWTADSC